MVCLRIKITILKSIFLDTVDITPLAYYVLMTDRGGQRSEGL